MRSRLKHQPWHVHSVREGQPYTFTVWTYTGPEALMAWHRSHLPYERVVGVPHPAESCTVED